MTSFVTDAPLINASDMLYVIAGASVVIVYIGFQTLATLTRRFRQ